MPTSRPQGSLQQHRLVLFYPPLSSPGKEISCATDPLKRGMNSGQDSSKMNLAECKSWLAKNGGYDMGRAWTRTALRKVVSQRMDASGTSGLSELGSSVSQADTSDDEINLMEEPSIPLTPPGPLTAPETPVREATSSSSEIICRFTVTPPPRVHPLPKPTATPRFTLRLSRYAELNVEAGLRNVATPLRSPVGANGHAEDYSSHLRKLATVYSTARKKRRQEQEDPKTGDLFSSNAPLHSAPLSVADLFTDKSENKGEVWCHFRSFPFLV